MSRVTVVASDSVAPVELPGGSWSRVLVDGSSADSPNASMGCSVFKAGTETKAMRHEADELAFVTAGQGFLRLDSDLLTLKAGQACHIPAGVWHSVGADDQDMEMVFAFASASYPPTEFRDLS